MPERRMLEPQLLDLVLREVADRESLAGVHLARHRRQLAAQQLQQRRLAGAVRSEQTDPFARQQRPLQAAQHSATAVADRDVLEPDQLAWRALRLGERAAE